MVKSKENLVGAYAFLVGVVLAVAFGVLNKSLEDSGELFYSVLVVIGIIIGFMNMTDKNSMNFLFASLSLILIGSLVPDSLWYPSQEIYVVNLTRNILRSLLVLFTPATIIVALKSVFSLAKV